MRETRDRETRNHSSRERASYDRNRRNTSELHQRRSGERNTQNSNNRQSSNIQNRRPLTDEERRRIRERNFKKRQRNSKIFRATVLGVGGIIIISLIILLFKSCTGGESNNTENSSSTSASDSTSVSVSTPSVPVISDTTSVSAPGDSELLDKLWLDAYEREAEELAIEAEKQRLEEEERILANTPTEDYAQEKSIKGLEIEELSSMLIIGDSAYPYYKFDLEAAQDFAAAVNKAPSDIDVYSLIVPSKIDIELSLSVLRDYPNETSDQRKAIRYINSLMNENVIKLNVYDRFKAHCDEDLFFKADSRSTSLASYYAYTLWAEKKGITPLKLEELEKVSFENFNGSISLANEGAGLSNSDIIDIYRADTNLSLSVKIDGNMQGWPIYTNVTDYGASYKYSTFLAGSDNYAVITNNEINDDSACIIVKDASGNSFAPFVAEHYKNTYVVDYRNYKGSLDKLVNETGAMEIIFYIPIESTNNSSTASKISKLA